MPLLDGQPLCLVFRQPGVHRSVRPIPEDLHQRALERNRHPPPPCRCRCGGLTKTSLERRLLSSWILTKTSTFLVQVVRIPRGAKLVDRALEDLRLHRFWHDKAAIFTMLAVAVPLSFPVALRPPARDWRGGWQEVCLFC